MTLFEEDPDGAVVFTCPNVDCGRTFTTPLKAVNIQQSSETVYDACPYCLTKMTCNERIDAPAVEEPYECKYHLGYLRERKEKTEVPDRCLVCKDMVVCMLGELKR